MAKILLEMKNITKTFPGVKALDNVNLQVEEGEIHALVGENGAGNIFHFQKYLSQFCFPPFYKSCLRRAAL